MSQLHITIERALILGFKGRNVDNKRVYELKTLNGKFYYNPEEDEYVWYHTTNIGKNSNHVHLNIYDEDDLATLLRIFRV